MIAESSGTWAIDGQASSSLSQMVATEHGLNLAKHRSQAISLDMIKSSDLILCMTPTHKRDLLQIFPHFAEKIFTLKEYVREIPPKKLAVDDPIGMNLNFYRRIYKDIDSEIRRILPEIKKNALKKTEINV